MITQGRGGDTCINEIERVTVTSAAIQANEDTRGGRGIQSIRTKGRRRNKRSIKWGTINARSLGKKNAPTGKMCGFA